MNQTIGFIGCGKMAQAMIGGMLSSELIKPEQLIVSARTEKTREKVASRFGIRVTEDNVQVAKEADILFLGIVPQLHETIVKQCAAYLEQTIVVTIAAGITLERMDNFAERKLKVVRTMPNTPSLVKAGMTALCSSTTVSEQDLEPVLALLGSFGEVEIISEQLMDAIPSISGSSPAYVYMMIEAMADGGVAQGIPREQAYRLAAQAVYGAAKMVLDTNLHPGVLKDQVCSPGGATIEAVATLEKEGFRGAVLTGMESCTQKVKQLGK